MKFLKYHMEFWFGMYGFVPIEDISSLEMYITNDKNKDLFCIELGTV